MFLPEKCREVYLDGITEVRFFPAGNSQIPVPYSVPQLLEIRNCKFSDPALHLSTYDESRVLSEGLVVKTTIVRNGNSNIYTIEISANITIGKDKMREIHKIMEGNDFYPVFTTQTGETLLGYTLPHTFYLDTPISQNDVDKQRNLSIRIQSLSEPIPITLTT